MHGQNLLHLLIVFHDDDIRLGVLQNVTTRVRRIRRVNSRAKPPGEDPADERHEPFGRIESQYADAVKRLQTELKNDVIEHIYTSRSARPL